jgi:cytochrome c oxidase assembly protein subunit 15
VETSGLHRFALLVATCTLFLVVAGAMVVSLEAGLSVPDWPLSYGKVMPAMEGGVFYEHGHRMIATAVGFLTIVLAVWLQRSQHPKWMKRIGWGALGLVILQGVFGGLTVLYLLPKAISITHASIAQIFFTTTVLMALFTSRSWNQSVAPLEDSGWPSMRSMAIFAPLATLGQVALGAGFRHKLIGVLPHILGAFAITLVLVYFCVVVFTQYSENRPMRRAATALLWITLAQVVLGIAAYLTRLSFTGDTPAAVMVAFTVAHTATGALTLAFTAVLSALTWKFVGVNATAAHESGTPKAARA